VALGDDPVSMGRDDRPVRPSMVCVEVDAIGNHPLLCSHMAPIIGMSIACIPT